MVKKGQNSSTKVSEDLRANANKILTRWEERVRREVSASSGVPSLDLRDGLLDYLIQLSDEISRTSAKTKIAVQEARKKSKLFGKAKGAGRADLLNYSLDQVIFEYHILREVIFEILEENGPLETRERDIIITSVEEAVNDTASFFSSAIRDLQEVFMLTLVHDLRGPLATIGMAEQVLQDADDLGTVKQVAAPMKNCIERMESMIVDLLDSSRLKAGQTIPLQFEIFNLDELIVEAMTDFESEKDRFILRLKPIGGHWSRDGLCRVIENLVSNALKYGSKEEPITITLEESESTAIVLIDNCGNPIPQQEQSAIFEQFHRRSPKAGGGWGIGLTLVKGIVEAHRGTVRVESGASTGTTFIIDLPKFPVQIDKLKPFRTN